MKTINSFFTKKRFKWSFGIILLLIALIISGGIIQKNNKNNLRSEYESFLNSEFAKLPSADMKAVKEEPKADMPDRAAIRNYFMTLDPALQAVPSYRLKSAYQQTKALTNSNSFKSGHTIQWESRLANRGGRTRTIMFDPNDTNNGKVWAGAVSGGLWKIEDAFDAHESWVPVDDFWENLAISCMTYDPNNTQVFYVGTGESQTAVTIYRESGGRGSGILKSVDGGETWNFLASTENFAYVSDIIVRNENGQSIIYAAALSGKYWGDQTSTPTDGLYRSEDGGESWEQVLPNIEGLDVPYSVSDIEMNGNKSRIYVGTTYNINGDGASCILYSDNGTDWTLIDDYREVILARNNVNIPGRVVLAAAPSDPNIILAGFAAGSPNRTGGFIGYDCPLIIKSIDNGQSWNELAIPGNNPLSFPGNNGWAFIAWHALVFEFHPENPDIIWAGALSMWRSSDGGQSWQFANGHTHADQHIIEFRPGSPEQFLVGSDGGIHISYDAGADFPDTESRNQGFNTLQFYACAIHPDEGVDYFLGGLQDNGTTLYRGDRPANDSDVLSGGDGAYCHIAKHNGQTLSITASQYSTIYYYIGNNTQRPTFAGQTFYGLGDFINPSDWDSTNHTFVANAGTTNGFLLDTIFVITIPEEENGMVFLSPLNTGSTVLFSNVKVSQHSPLGSTTVFLGSMSGGLFKVETASAFPSSTNIGSPDFPTAYISGIDIGQTEDEIIVTFSNYGVESVWLTMDGGVNWRNIDGNLPDMPVRWVIFHPQNSNQAMIATEIGVWEATDLNEENVEWLPVLNGMANVRVDMLRVRAADNIVLAATHGRGLYTGEWPVANYSGVKNNIISGLNVKTFPNPVDDILNVSFSVDGIKDVRLEINDLNGKTVVSDILQNITGNYTREIDLSNNSTGIYFVKISTDNGSQTKKIVLK
ncbi:T9SS type A sorting domain-containing protein [Bacteroidota bacterium]